MKKSKKRIKWENKNFHRWYKYFYQRVAYDKKYEYEILRLDWQRQYTSHYKNLFKEAEIASNIVAKELSLKKLSKKAIEKKKYLYIYSTNPLGVNTLLYQWEKEELLCHWRNIEILKERKKFKKLNLCH